MAGTVPITVIETPEFLSATRKLISDEKRALLVDYLAYHPTAGDLIPGTGGVRKLRWSLEGRGKRGGARVVYFYHDPEVPIFALTAYVVVNDVHFVSPFYECVDYMRAYKPRTSGYDHFLLHF